MRFHRTRKATHAHARTPRFRLSPSPTTPSRMMATPLRYRLGDTLRNILAHRQTTAPHEEECNKKEKRQKKRRHDGNQVLSFMSGEARRACLFADVRRGRARNFSVHHTRACVCARPRRLSYESVFVQHMRTCLLIVYCLAREINKSFAYLINQRIN